MKGHEKRLAELEAKLARLERELATVAARPAALPRGKTASWIGKADSAISKGSSGTVSVYAGETDTTLNVTAKALGAAVGSGKWCTLFCDQAGKWYVGCWES